MKACILIKVDPGKHSSISKNLEKVKGVKAAFITVGRTDVAANVDVRSIQELSELSLKIGRMQGVHGTETLIGLEGEGN